MADVEVCIHDPREQLPASQCVLCNGRVARERAAEARRVVTVGNAFAAKYEGVCIPCDGRVYPGDLVVYVNDLLVHVECRENAISSWSGQ